ncbi:MAG: SufD family Fe-S cluster assembly protein [Proteobacteria bacterium]|nr:SufD family Fe-S cluster assembly protein [Pseudomonadota bacterium]
MFKDPINIAFDKLTGLLNEPKWLQQKRIDAFKTFQDTGLPTRKSELWKYTDVNRLERLKEVTDLAGSGSVLFIDKENSEIDTVKPINGTDPLKKRNFTEINQDNWQDVQTDKERVFIELNMAMLNSGFELSIPANSQLKLHIQYQQVTADWENIRTVINVGENAQLDLTESYDYDCRINHVSIINMQNNTQLKLQSNKLLAKTAALIHYSKINCAENVTIQQCTVNNNAYLSHSIQDVDFNGEHSTFKAASINVVHDSCHISENIQINHFVGNCKSEVIKRSLATDKGQVATNAKAVVSVAADGSDVAQSLKNILLSDDAKIYSRPELEINTDDVIAAHGSTIGELDKLSLDYLRSRGIPKEQAKFMLIESFLQDANIFKTEDFLDKIEL